jgi:LacI family transcriptional regulator
MTVAALVRDASCPFSAAMALAAERELRDAGYAMLVSASRGPEPDAAQVSHLRRRRVDGLLLSLADESDAATLEEVRRLRSPVVLVDCELAGVEGTSAVLCDHAGGVERVVEQLRGLGHRRAGLVAGTTASRPGRELVRAFEAACGWLSIRAAVEREATDPAAAEAAAGRLLDGRRRPTAIVSGSAAILPGVLRAVRAAGLRVPADVSVVTVDDAPLLAAVAPPIAAFDRDPVAVGSQAARLLLDRIRGGPPETSSVAIRFTPRASCGPAPDL